MSIVNLHTIIGVTDFSVLGGAALDRAAMLAKTHHATLEIMSLPSAEGPSGTAALANLTAAAEQLAERHALAVRPIAQVANSLADLAEEADSADLIVLPAAPERAIRTWLHGYTAERLLRLSWCPMLVVKEAPRRPYEQILVSVDFKPQSQTLVELAARIDGKADITLFHALGTQIETRLRSSDVAPDIIRDWRESCMRDARQRLHSFADGLGAQRERIRHALGRGEPGHQVASHQKRNGADLTVVGKHRSSMFTDLLFGAVAHQVLREATSDVLVVPHDYRPAARRTLSPRQAAPHRTQTSFALASARQNAA